MPREKKEIEIPRCGTTVNIDLTGDVMCNVKVLLGNSEVRRILQATLDILPAKQKEKVEQPIQSVIKALSQYSKEFEISILPVTNKRALNEWNALKV